MGLPPQMLAFLVWKVGGCIDRLIDEHLIPALVGDGVKPSSAERELLSFPHALVALRF